MDIINKTPVEKTDADIIFNFEMISTHAQTLIYTKLCANREN